MSNNGISVKSGLMGEHNTMGKSDGITNITTKDIRKAINGEFNNNIRRFVVNKYSGL